MKKRSWSRRWFSHPVPRPIRQTPHRVRPALEALEDRWVPSPAIVVNNPTDPPVVGQTDLRQAIAQANTSTVDIKTSVVNGNKANGSVLGQGGGIYSSSGSALTLTATNVKGNKATTSAADLFNGP